MSKPSLATIRHLLLDMDGTVYLGPNPIPGARELITYLRESGRGFLFFTNNSSADASRYAEKLSVMGIPARPEEILTSGEATVRYIRSQTPYRRVYVVGTPSFESEVEAAGLSRTADDPEAVILAFDRTLTYAKLERACLLVRAGLPYYATNPDKVCPTEYGYIPDCGSMTALVQEATGRMPQCIGKPNPEMVRMALAKLDAAPECTAMVGDRLYTDMEMAHRSDITSILVLSGETREADIAEMRRKPDFVFASVQKLHEALMAEDKTDKGG